MADSSSRSSSDNDEGRHSTPPSPLPQPPSPPPQPPRKSAKRKTDKPASEPSQKRQRTSVAIQQLADKVSEITNFLGNFCQPIYHSSEFGDELNADVSREMYSEEDREPTALTEPPGAPKLSLNTVLKEPSVPRSTQAHIDAIQAIQHFDSEDWAGLRYAEVQKNYCSRPGFVELETNEEVKPYDKFTNLSLTERGFAAITQALIKQQEAAQNAFDSLIAWSEASTDLSPQSLVDKIKELFVDGDFQKISNDVLQLACGHRADLIQQRRDNILRSVKDKYFKANLRKIPPSSECLFKKEIFSSAVEKNGGSSKTFWPVRQPYQNKPAAQAGSSQNNYKIPAQGIFEPMNFYQNMPRMSLPAQGNHPYLNPLRWRGDMHRPPLRQKNFQAYPPRQRGTRAQFSDDTRQNNARGQGKTSGQNYPRREYYQNQKRKP